MPIKGDCTHEDHPHEIEDIYKLDCKDDWTYWNPWHSQPKDSLVGRCCKTCSNCER